MGILYDLCRTGFVTAQLNHNSTNHELRVGVIGWNPTKPTHPPTHPNVKCISRQPRSAALAAWGRWLWGDNNLHYEKHKKWIAMDFALVMGIYYKISEQEITSRKRYDQLFIKSLKILCNTRFFELRIIKK